LKVWNDPVWSKVIAGVILTVLAVIGTRLLNWWPTIGRFINSVWGFISSATVVPNWLLGLLCLLSLPMILLICVLVWSKFHPSQNKGPDWHTYTSDIFEGIRWRWHYSYDAIGNLYPYCPKCNLQINPDDSMISLTGQIRFYCDGCNWKLRKLSESEGSLENKVKRLINQKISNGKWIEQNKT
jgi:hypothetical protein